MENSTTLETRYRITIDEHEVSPLQFSAVFDEYTVIFIRSGMGIYHADNLSFPFAGPEIVFGTPGQAIHLEPEGEINYSILQFHPDFYCIDAHDEAIACNGLLFNTVHTKPAVTLTGSQLTGFSALLEQVRSEIMGNKASDIVLKAYLQVFLAKCSNLKSSALSDNAFIGAKDDKMEEFKKLLDQHYLSFHRPNDYAQLLIMAPNTLSKRAVRYFGRTPSQLIQDRLVMEAKKLLHLTALSIKEIAFKLKFSDEYYFSRFFKKNTDLSPQGFRNKRNY